MEELCKLFGKSCQACYERINYRISQGVEESEIMRMVKQVQISHYTPQSDYCASFVRFPVD